jgi:hypothetical protein
MPLSMGYPCTFFHKTKMTMILPSLQNSCTTPPLCTRPRNLRRSSRFQIDRKSLQSSPTFKKNQEALCKQVQAIYKTAEPTERQLLNVDRQLTSARRRLQENRAHIHISNRFLILHPPVDDTMVYPMIPPPHHLAMPQLHDEPEGHTPSHSKKTPRMK